MHTRSRGTASRCTAGRNRWPRDGTLSMTPNTAFFDAYRDEPRWQRLLAKLGLDEATLSAIPLVTPALL